MTEIVVRRLLVGDELAERLAKAGLVEAHFSRDRVVLIFKEDAVLEHVLHVLAQAGSDVVFLNGQPVLKAS